MKITSRVAVAVAAAFVLVAATTASMLPDRPAVQSMPVPDTQVRAIDVQDDLIPSRRETPPPPPPPAPKPKPKPKPAAPARDLTPYKGLGAWVDLYDYAIRDKIDPASTVDELARRGVKTLYLQTSRFKEPADIVNPEAVNIFLERSHAKGMKVVAWYVPGFGDMARDLRRSLLAINYVSPNGHRFDGFSPDIESREEVAGDRQRFNAGISEYSRLLREAVPRDTVLAATVVDAKNNERAPARWEGFPWKDIARYYDVVLSMAYWTVTKKESNCDAQYDVASYMKEVVSKTEALMGTSKPIHPIGGIADCTSPAEVAAYVSSIRAMGALGGSLYDFQTTQSNPSRDQIWAELSKLN